MGDYDKYVRIKTYADRYGVSVTTVNNWANSGEVTIEKIDGIKFINLKKSKKEHGNKED